MRFVVFGGWFGSGNLGDDAILIGLRRILTGIYPDAEVVALSTDPEYTKRVWHLLQRWRRERPEPLEFTNHMTNALMLPIQTWATADLDHELDTKVPFSPEWLRVETIGRQIGNLPLTLYPLTGKGQPA